MLSKYLFLSLVTGQGKGEAWGSWPSYWVLHLEGGLRATVACRKSAFAAGSGGECLKMFSQGSSSVAGSTKFILCLPHLLNMGVRGEEVCGLEAPSG